MENEIYVIKKTNQIGKLQGILDGYYVDKEKAKAYAEELNAAIIHMVKESNLDPSKQIIYSVMTIHENCR